MEKYKIIGKAVPILDAAAKAAGQFKFTDDIKLPGMLYAKVLFSTVPHGRIKVLDTAEAEALPGVRAVASYKNSSRVCYNSTTRLLSQKFIENEVIFTDTVRFIGDRIAAVAADTLAIAEEAIKLIKVEYEELPHYTDPLEAMREGAYPLHGESNVVAELVRTAGDVDKALAEADHVFEDTYYTPAVHHGAIETHTAIADFDARGKLTVISPCQNTFGCRIVLHKLFGLPMNKIRVINPGMGGAFGGKLEYTIEPVVAQLAKLCGRPVKLAYNRKETMVSTRTRHATVIKLKTGVMADGTIIAQDIRAVSNTGAYASNAMNLIGTMSSKVFRLYKAANVRFTGIPVYTNTPIAGAMRGYGSPQFFFAQQRQLHKICKALNLDYIDVQYKNLPEPDAVDPRTGKLIGNPRPKDCLDRALELKKNWQPLDDENGKYIISEGLAMGMHGSSVSEAHLDHVCVTIKMNEDASCIVYTGTHEMGQSTLTSQLQAIAEILHMPLEMMECVSGDTDLCGWGVGDFSSRGVYVNVYAAKKAAEGIRRAMLEAAARLMEESAENLLLEESTIYSKASGKRVDKQSVMNYAQCELHQDIMCTVTHHATFAPASYGAHIARVRIEKAGGKVEVTDYVAVHDVGKVINQFGVEGQLEGAVQMGIGYALQEQILYDKEGKTKHNSLRRYKMPTATQMPGLQTDFIEEIEPTGPFGAKSIGECAVVPSAPAIINAICNGLDIEINSLPYRGRQ